MLRVSLSCSLVVVGAVAVFGCGEPGDSGDAPRPATTSGTGGAVATTRIDSGGSGGGGDGGASGGGTGSAGSSQAGGAGAGGGQGTGGAQATTSTQGGVEPWSCAEDLGYWATKTTFSYPTPQGLAAALNQLAYEVESRPISLVLRTQTGTLTGALSATSTGVSGTEVFPEGQVPLFAEVIPADGQGVTTEEAQPKAFLRFVDVEGPVVLEIEHLVWRATEYFSCNLVWVDVEAVVPAAALGTVLHLESGTLTVEELLGKDAGANGPDPGSGVESPGGGSPGSGPVGAQLHFSFQGTPMAFDFGSL